MNEHLVVSMTGFVNDPQEQVYKKMIADLHIRLAPTLSEETSILIVNDVTSEKYKIAKTYDPPITCVSIEWLLQCKKKNKIIMNNEIYKINKIFYGACIKVLDFDTGKSRKIEQKIQQFGGVVKVLKNNNQLHDAINQGQKISLLLTTKQNFVRLRPYMDKIVFPIVDIEWLQDSVRRDICKYPFDYALNQFYICQKEPVDHLKKMKNKLDNYLKAQVHKFQNNILENTIIYIGDNVNVDLAKVLKKIIMLYGGFYLDILSPVITHILTEPLLEQEYGELKIYGTLVSLIRVEWLIDSIYLNKRMLEEDYFIRSFKSKINSTLHLEERTSSHNNSSLSYNSNPSIPTFLGRQSISIPVHNIPKVKMVKAVKKYESSIFKDYTFYVESTQSKERQLSEVSHKIIKNGGEVFPSRITIRSGFVFYIMVDGPDAAKCLDRLKNDTKAETKKIQIQPISYRWVNECIAKGQFIDYNKVESYIYKPFCFTLPIKDFHKMTFDVLGVEDIKKMRIKQLYNTLGSTRNTPNRVELTHCLCGESYKETTRYKDIKKQNQKVKYLDWKWVLECANAGKIVQIDTFVLESEVMSTQESQYSIRSYKALRL